MNLNDDTWGGVVPPPDQAVEIISRGTRSRALMESEVFREAMRDVESLHVAGLLACAPTERDREARDYHHLMLSAFKEIAATLAGYVQAGEETQRLLKGRDVAAQQHEDTL